jgi:hypothetical protein
LGRAGFKFRNARIPWGWLQKPADADGWRWEPAAISSMHGFCFDAAHSPVTPLGRAGLSAMGSQQPREHLLAVAHVPWVDSSRSCDALCAASAIRAPAACLTAACCAPASNTAPTSKHRQSRITDIRLIA